MPAGRIVQGSGGSIRPASTQYTAQCCVLRLKSLSQCRRRSLRGAFSRCALAGAGLYSRVGLHGLSTSTAAVLSNGRCNKALPVRLSTFSGKIQSIYCVT